jgi:replicative superfamily II helicase
MMANFAKHLGWADLEMLLTNMRKRLNSGVKADLLPLVEIPGVKKARARALWNGGFRSVQAVANADVSPEVNTTYCVQMR